MIKLIKLFKMQILFILIFTFLGLNSYSSPLLSAEEGITEKIENEKKELEKLKTQIEERRKKSKEAAKRKGLYYGILRRLIISWG